MDLAKLSRLQRWILYAAFDNRSGDPDAPGVDLYYHEVLAGYFGFPMRWYGNDDLRSHPGSHRFDREEIGRERYDAAQASLSRAVRRLEARGLVERYEGAASRWAGLRLADAAIEAASKCGDDSRVMEAVKTLAAPGVLTVCHGPVAGSATVTESSSPSLG